MVHSVASNFQGLSATFVKKIKTNATWHLFPKPLIWGNMEISGLKTPAYADWLAAV